MTSLPLVFAFGRLLVGGLFLYLGAEWLVGGASRLARSFGVRPLVVGLTVVAYGTSAPEAVVAVRATVEGSAPIAVGNVIGSNIANIGLVLGLVALAARPRADAVLRTRELPVVTTAALLLAFLLTDSAVTRLEGMLLLGGSILYTAWMARTTVRVESEANDEGESTQSTAGRLRMLGLAAIGLVVLVVGGDQFVDGAATLARTFGTSERVIGLTVVAVGTSLPELATSLVAAARGQADLAIGNVVGSNIFNVLLCLGLAGLVAPFAIDVATVRLDIGVMLAFTLALAIVLRTERRVSRVEGAVFVVAYVSYVTHLALE